MGVTVTTSEHDGHDSGSAMESIRLDDAKAIVEACEAEARSIDNPIVITVTNSEGGVIAQHRMDDARLGSVDISRNKAYTAAAFDVPTHELTEPSQPGNSLYGIHNTNQGRIVIFGGGYPLVADGDVVGAVGASGGAVDQDMTVAEAGISAFESLVS